jgi:hypothetical protein
MHQLRRAQDQFGLLGSVVLAGLITLGLFLPAVGQARHPANSSQGYATGATLLAANVTGGLPAGGVLADPDDDNGLADILAIDPSGNLWLYPGTDSNQNTFSTPRSQVGIGWNGYTLAAVGGLYATGSSGGSGDGIVATDPAGNLWYYPDTGGTGLSTFGTPTQIGTGWNGYTVAGLADLNSAPGEGIVATDPAGNLWYYPGTGMTGLSTFGSRILVGTGWTGYTADVTNVGPVPSPTVVVAVDRNGNLWLYPNTGGSGIATFGAPTQIGSGWSGWRAFDLGALAAANQADIFAIDASGNLWLYPNANTGASDWASWGAPIQVGTGWTGYRIN